MRIGIAKNAINVQCEIPLKSAEIQNKSSMLAQRWTQLPRNTNNNPTSQYTPLASRRLVATRRSQEWRLDGVGSARRFPEPRFSHVNCYACDRTRRQPSQRVVANAFWPKKDINECPGHEGNLRPIEAKFQDHLRTFQDHLRTSKKTIWASMRNQRRIPDKFYSVGFDVLAIVRRLRLYGSCR